MNLEKLLQEYLTNSELMQLATVSKGQPWLCNVYFVADENNNIYWTSTRARRHSKEIIKYTRVAATIVHDSKNKQALQITGDAFEVPLPDMERVYNLYGKKFGMKASRLAEALENKPDGRAFYILKPTSISFWDEVNFPDNPKQVLGI